MSSPPAIIPEKPVTTTERKRPIGFTGPLLNTDSVGFVKRANPGRADSHEIPTEAIPKLKGLGVDSVLIIDEPKTDVYEYPAEEYYSTTAPSPPRNSALIWDANVGDVVLGEDEL